MRKLKIAQICSPTESVPPKKYGGTELVAYHLVEGLTKKGHNVTLFASGDSKVSCRLVPLSKKSEGRIQLPSGKIGQRKARQIKNVNRIIRTIKIINRCVREKFDVIHSHVGWESVAMTDFIDTPIVKTFHGPMTEPISLTAYSQFPEGKYVSISKNQQRLSPEIKYAANIYNGIGIEQYEFNDKPKDYLIFLGRISPEKGIINSIKAAKGAGKKLLLVGKVDPYDQEYYETKVKPLIDGHHVEFIGEVGNLSKRKSDLYKNALAYLFPINWEEPFGLAMVEAMACGTPVIATRRASAKEVVVDGKTGFLVNTKNPVPGMIKAIKNIDKISRAACRRHVEKNFTNQVMVDKYEKLYHKITKK